MHGSDTVHGGEFCRNPCGGMRQLGYSLAMLKMYQMWNGRMDALMWCRCCSIFLTREEPTTHLAPIVALRTGCYTTSYGQMANHLTYIQRGTHARWLQGEESVRA
eukprot:365180-Chlamydomonas_euryale.AAC.9